MMNHKHESDLTPAERKHLLHQRLNRMSGIERFEYLVSYYWGYAAAVAALIALIVWGIGWVGRLQQNTVLTVALMESELDDTSAAELKTTLSGVLGLTDPHDIIKLDTSLIYLDRSTVDRKTYNAYLEKELLLEESGLDVYLVPKEFYEDNKDTSTWMSLQALLGEEYATYSSQIVDDTALVLTDSPLSDSGAVGYGPVYLIVMEGSKHTDAIISLIHYLTN